MSHGGGTDQDFELNIASIIDCFTVLIAFMLASASFLSIGILDAGIAAGGTTAAEGTPPPVNVSVELGTGKEITVKVTGKETSSQKIAAKQGAKGPEWNVDAMNAQLAGIKGRWKDVSAITLSADNAIEYEEIVRNMEAARKTMPVVLLGGF
jgi:biopolymer transport protein ExbD